MESGEELEALNEALATAALPSEAQKQAACCYARSDKYWTVDPQGIAWEAFHSLESIPVFGEDNVVELKSVSACGPPPDA